MSAKKRSPHSSSSASPLSERRAMPLTYNQVVKAVACLGNQCDSEVISMRRIQRRLVNEGRDVSLEQIKKALQRAVKAGMIAEVVENRYKTVRTKCRKPKAGTSGKQRKARPRDRVVAKLAAGRRPKAGTFRPKPLAPSRAKKAAPKKLAARAGRPSTSAVKPLTASKRPVLPKQAALPRGKLATVSRELLRSSSTSMQRPSVSRDKLAIKTKQLLGLSRSVDISAVKSRIKLLARAIATATAKNRRAASAHLKKRTALLKLKKQGLQKGTEKQRGRERGHMEVGKESDSDAFRDDSGVSGGELGREVDSVDIESKENDVSTAGTSEGDLAQEPPREATLHLDSVPLTLPTSIGYGVVSIFPAWAK